MYRMPAARPEENRILNPATPALAFDGELASLGYQIGASTVCRVAGGSFTLRLSQNRT